MTEPSAQPIVREPRRPSAQNILDLVVGLVFTPTLAFFVWKLNRWPIALFGAISIGIPLLAISARAWRRLSHPERVPLCWPERYLRSRRLETVQQALWWTWIITYVPSIVIRHRYNEAHELLLVFSVGCASWSTVLRRYIADRKFVPPPNPPKVRSGTTARLRSDYWGCRDITSSGDEIPQP